MYKVLYLFIVLLLFFCTPFFAKESELPSPMINGVDIITGKTELSDSSFIKNEYYVIGKNEVAGITISLSAGDFRVGRVRLQKVLSDEEPKTLHTIAQFIYSTGQTAVLDGLNHRTVYHFKNSLITSIDQYKGMELYRKERYFWEGDALKPRLVSRVLENGQGEGWSCCLFDYNSEGLLTTETLIGNLSGECLSSISVNSNGRPIGNKHEQYSVHYTYTPEGQLLTKKEDNGCITEYTYDSSTKQCISKVQRDAFQELTRVTYAYDNEGFLSKTEIKDGASHQILEIQSSHEKTSLGQPLMTQAKYIDPQSQQEQLLEKTIFSYSPKGELVYQNFYDSQNHLCYSISMEYNDSGEIIKVVDSRGEKAAKKSEDSSHYRYNLYEQQIALIDKYGNETQYEYDHVGRLIKTIFPQVLNENGQVISPMSSQDYDIANNIISSCDPRGHRTEQKFTIRGKSFEILSPDGSIEKVYYHLDGTERERISKNGSKIYFMRDAFGRISKSISYSASGNVTQVLDYKYIGSQIESVTDNQNYTLFFSYDGAGRQIASVQMTLDGTKTLKWTYDASGQQNEIKEWFGASAEAFVTKLYERDQWQRLIHTLFAHSSGEIQKKIQADSPDETPSFYVTNEDATVNERGQHVKREEIVDGHGVREIITYDALGRIEKKETFNSLFIKLKEIQLRYDASGNKAAENHTVLSEGHSSREYLIVWKYDSMNRVTDIIEGLGSLTQKNTHYRYNQNGDLIETLKPDGIKISYQYDADSRLWRWQASDHSFAYEYDYDNRQRVTRISDSLHLQNNQRFYDAFNQIIGEKLGNGLLLESRYDLAGRRTALILPDRSSVKYHYDGTLLRTIERFAANSTPTYQHRYDYNAEGKLIRSHLIGDAGTIDFAYNPSGRINSLNSPWWSQSLNEYSFDPYRNITSDIIEDHMGEEQRNFQYSQDHQLISEGKQQYQYDSLYNRLDGDINALNQLVRCGESFFSYDENGNRIEKKQGNDRWLYRYDALDRLTRVEHEGQCAIEYIYDAFHRRLSQKSSLWDSHRSEWIPGKTEYFAFDGDREIGKTDEHRRFQELRILGTGKGAEIGSAIALELQGQTYAPIHDLQGSVRCLIEMNSANPDEFYRYTAFGEEQIFDSNGILLENTAVSNPWRFSSKRFDAETGLIHFGKRYYDPSIGRWLTPDPLFFYDTPNLYAFVKNNPLVHQDLYGLFSIRSIWETISSVASNAFNFFKSLPHRFIHTLDAVLSLPEFVTDALAVTGKKLLGMDIFSLFDVQYDKVETGVYGNGEISNKLRVTFINGLFTTRAGLTENLELISKTHGGINVHYIFRPTEGWSTDIPKAAMIKWGFSTIGYRSSYAYLLAQKWQDLIQEMGGVNGGGIITHYAHSLGGTDTDRARQLLTPEEQKMIRVITIGSSTLVRSGGFQSVINYASLGDYVPLVDIFGQIRNFFDPNSNVSLFGSYSEFPHEHPLRCPSYQSLIEKLGRQFLVEHGLA